MSERVNVVKDSFSMQSIGRRAGSKGDHVDRGKAKQDVLVTTLV